MPPFVFYSVAQVLFGRGLFERIGDLAAERGRRVLLLTNAGQPGDGRVVDRALGLLAGGGVSTSCYRQRGEPTVEQIEQALAVARQNGCDGVIGLGGGSALDAAKAVAALLANGGSPLDYMEVIGRGQKLTRPAVPWIAVPTTAGTGAEATRNAVIGAPERSFKASLRSEFLLASLALIDPALAVDVPAAVTASSGMDALCQLIESYTSNQAQPITDALALDGIRRAARWLTRAVADGHDLDAREQMALAAFVSGVALTNAGLGAVHGFAAPTGACYPIPHGTVCALLLPPVIEANAAALRSQSPNHETLRKYETLGRVLTGRDELSGEAAIAAAVEFLRDLVSRFQIPGLSHFGIQASGFADLVGRARKSSSMRYNPVELSVDALHEILYKAL